MSFRRLECRKLIGGEDAFAYGLVHDLRSRAPLTLPKKKMTTSTTVLQESLERHNSTFEALLELIPPKYYLVSKLTDEQVHSKKKFMQGHSIYHCDHRAGRFKVPEAQQETKSTQAGRQGGFQEGQERESS